MCLDSVDAFVECGFLESRNSRGAVEVEEPADSTTEKQATKAEEPAANIGDGVKTF